MLSPQPYLASLSGIIVVELLLGGHHMVENFLRIEKAPNPVAQLKTLKQGKDKKTLNLL
jgi:hypothetical protein